MRKKCTGTHPEDSAEQYEIVMRGKIIRILLVAVVISAVHGLISSQHLDHPPHFDEMYHMLAAESNKAEGSYRILDGEYTRASLYTKIIASRMYLFENSLESARFINIIFSVIMVIGIVFVVGVFFNTYVAVLVGTFMATNPEIVTSAHTVRFYTLHSGIFFAFAALFLYIFLNWKDKWNLNFLFGIPAMLVLFCIAYHLQVTTIIGIGGMMIGFFIANVYEICSWFKQIKIVKKICYIFLLIGILICGAIILNDKLIALVSTFKSYPEWASTHASNKLYYYYIFEQWYPALWPLMPIFFVLSFIQWPKETIYISSIFIVTLIFLSFAPQKGTRYICFALPFAFMPLSAGIVVLGNALIFYVKKINTILSKRTFSMMYFPLISLAIILFVITQPVVRSSYGLIAHGNPSDFYYNLHQPDWEMARNSLKSQITGEYTLVASAGIKSAYYFGDYSYDINKSLVAETDTGREFGLDLRTGRRAISSPSSLEYILNNCTPVIVILEAKHIKGIAVDRDIVNVLEKHGNRINLKQNDIHVWTIDHRLANGQASEIEHEYNDCLCGKVII